MLKRFRLSHIITGICAGFFIISAVALLSSYLGYSETGNIHEKQIEYKTGPAQKSVILNDLRAALGYGGMIHQFKNYVIRRDAPRVDKVKDRVNKAETAISEYLKTKHGPEEKQALETIRQVVLSYSNALDTAVAMVAENKSISEIDSVIKIDDGPALKAMKSLNDLISESRSEVYGDLGLSVNTLQQQFAFSAMVGLIVAMACSFFAVLAFRALYLQLGCEPAKLRTVADAIAEGNLDVDIGTSKKPVSGVLQAMITMRDNLRTSIESDHRISAENGRIKQALENSSGCLMIADADGKIIYMNNAIKDLMQTIESDIRKTVPAFDSTNLIGENLSVFHNDSARINDILNSITDTYSADMPIGDRRIRIIVNPVYGENRERLGNVAEWEDKTQQLLTEEEIQHIVNSAKTGDLSQRVDLNGKDGFFKRLSSGVNELVDVSDRAITDTASAISAISTGDLTRRIEGEYQGQFGQLKDDVNTTIFKLTEVVEQISRSAQSVLQASSTLANGNNDLSTRTVQQASNLEQTASSMEEMTSTVRQNAESAREANNLAASARNQATESGAVVNSAVQAMSEITDSSNKIRAIIGVIDEIAFQTNLLALNAAVEAARAGEQGRGFAVVASEVRNLAGRSATAANEIKQLIEDSVAKVDEGSRLVDESGKTLQEIVESVRSVSEIVAQIADASQDQRDGIDQVNHAISQMDEATQRNASLVDDASRSSQSLGEQARSLSELIGFFQTDSSTSSFKDSYHKAA